MLLGILISLCVNVITIVSGQECPMSWSLYKDHCYRHFMDGNDRVTFETAQERCKKYGGRLTDIKDLDELVFVGNLVRTPGTFMWNDLPLVGLYKTGQNNPLNVYDNSMPYINWCKPSGEPNDYLQNEHCIVIASDAYATFGAPSPPCLVDLSCDARVNQPYGYSRYVCKIPVVCDKPNTEAVNRTCVCKKDYIDITDTDVPEKTKYKKGELCIPKDPCKNVKDLFVNFLVDSSKSIGARNWDSLVSFLQSGADLLPNSTRVGFVKFSTNITFAKILSPGWSETDYKRFVPSNFDKGETNTAAAFDKARAMFKNDRSRKQVAVLITDGLPFDADLDEKEILSKTKSAAKKLRSSGVSLIALGYGEELDKKKIRVIHSWLEDPAEDYFEYDKNACDLKSVHMCLLMRKVCRRFVNY